MKNSVRMLVAFSLPYFSAWLVLNKQSQRCVDSLNWIAIGKLDLGINDYILEEFMYTMDIPKHS